jgi:ubiquinone/menaquinone biosynthesis C-methylase UbiE
MKSIRDPEGSEARNLVKATELGDKLILEIGCGTGWLTRQYAGMVRQVTGIDPGLTDLLEARADLPASMTNIRYVQSVGENLPFMPASFDKVLFSNSL